MEPMQKVRIQIRGVATHLQFTQNEAAPSSLAYGRRMVIPNCSQAVIDEPRNHVLKDHGVQPHVARLAMTAADVVSILGPANFTPFGDQLELVLEGVTLQVVNPIPNPQMIGDPPTTPTAIFNVMQCLPHLSHWTPDIVPGPVSLAKTPAAYAHFDFIAGFMTGFRTEPGAAITHYESNMFDDTQLLITPFDGSLPTLVTLHAGKEEHHTVDIVVQNIADSEGGDENPFDFVLNFLSGANPLPENFTGVPPIQCPLATNLLLPDWRPFTVTAACSNTGLP